jgi:hypothetical protein
MGWTKWTDVRASRAAAAALIGVVCGTVAVLVFRALARRQTAEPAERRDTVDVAVEDSFPASDPPSWTTGRS